MDAIVIDMLGGDKGLEMTVPAAQAFHAKYPDRPLCLSGPKEALEGLGIGEVIDAPENLPMDAGALEVIRHKDCSIMKGLSSMAGQKGEAIVSAGSTGGFLSAATLVLKKLPGILRPALVTAFPRLTEKGGFVTLLDVGANNENSPEELAQFAYMGTLYSQLAFGTKKPLTRLLSNGSEPKKGSPEGKAAYLLLEKDPRINFGGNAEANSVLLGDSDVIVTDGYSGNILLKGTEGAAKGMGSLLKGVFLKNLFTKLAYLACRKGVKGLKGKMDPKEVGGALLMGVNGIAVKAHGNSDSEAFFHALELAERLLEGDLLMKIEEGLAK